ncbi:hypothetical protein HFP51_04925 [Parasphingopyxis sp. CP4]|uniref:hypothetical protein n=1 Tax=Parasphingopyxis sp. CP4 TaxID=2724527 RepID=UPI0015A21BEF|nr:hypothetical protein [Parasphingopyxis sp. CP4]QLC21576.1 hypothetical protein HFP51_04925 [Parasphingopyxis sp. CP4]
MGYFILVGAIQLVTVIHVIRTDRPKLWILGIMIAPLLGSLAYFLLEVLPGMRGNRHVRYAEKKALEKIDPERELRQAREQLEITDSLANRTRLADALAKIGDHAGAIEHYEHILSGPHGREDKLLVRYASALFENGNAQKALDLFDEIEPVEQVSTQDRRWLLKARILEHLDRNEEAADLFADIVTRLAGIEARGRYAGLLLKMGRNDEAKAQLDEILHNSRQMDRTQIGDDKPILDWVRTTQRELSR